MSRESEFLIYCMERYRYYKSLSGKEVAELLKKVELMITFWAVSVLFILLAKNTL